MRYGAPNAKIGATRLAGLGLIGLLVIMAGARVARSQPTTVEGTLQVIIEDRQDHTSRTRYFLQISRKGTIELLLPASTRIPSARTGSHIQISGEESGGQLLLAASPATASGGGTFLSGLNVLSAPAPANTIGPQQTIFMLVNFQDQPALQPYTTAYASNFLLGTGTGTLNDYYAGNSFGQTSFAGNVVGWYTLPMNSADCGNLSNVAKYAVAAATTAGVNISAYSHQVYIMPGTAEGSHCSISGISTLGGNPSQSWIAVFNLHITAHELGHALRLDHSNFLACNRASIGVLGANCLTFEYGDTADDMGTNGGWPAFYMNAYQKENLGWFNNAGFPQMTTVTSAGTYSIEPLETMSANPKGLKIFKYKNAITGANEYYYVEYRQPVGYDSALATNMPQALTGILIRLNVAESLTAGPSQILDMTPQTFQSPYVGDPALAFGQTYTDPYAGISITAVSGDSSGAKVSVSFFTPGCVHNYPTITTGNAFTAAYSFYGNPGQSAAIPITVVNNDSAGCSAASFNLYADLPAGWIQSSTMTVVIPPGGMFHSTFTVTSPSAVQTGYHAFVEKSGRIDDPQYSSFGPFRYIVAPVPNDTTPPTVSISGPPASSAVSGIVSFQISATDNLGVSWVDVMQESNFYQDVAVAARYLSSSFTFTMDTTQVGNGMHNVGVLAYDYAGNSAVTSTMVQINNSGTTPGTPSAPRNFRSR